MSHSLRLCLFLAVSCAAPLLVSAQSEFSTSVQNMPNGSVIEHRSEPGELIVLRDDIIYWLSAGDDLFKADIVRSQNADTATISYNGCTMVLPEKQDVSLDDEFCALAALEAPSMAQIASEGGSTLGTTALVSNANAPLVLGGVVLSAGGIAAATNGGNGGTGSAASAAAGAAQATTASN